MPAEEPSANKDWHQSQVVRSRRRPTGVYAACSFSLSPPPKDNMAKEDFVKVFMWLDLETTGLNRERCEAIQVAGFLSYANDPFIHALDLPERVMRPSSRVLWEPGALHMHKRSGLFSVATNCCHFDHQVDTEYTRILCDYERKVREQRGDNTKFTYILAGSSVQFDRAFIDKQLPMLAAHLHYRHFDVTTLMMFAETLGIELDNTDKTTAHTAMADIKMSWQTARDIHELIVNAQKGLLC
jgi:oligoribonuclease